MRRMEWRCWFDIGVGSYGAGGNWSLKVPLKDHGGQVPSSLCDIRMDSSPVGWDGGSCTCANTRALRQGRRRAAVILRRYDWHLLPRGFRYYLLDVFVPSLWWLPVGVAERAGFEGEIQPVEEMLMRIFSTRSGRSHMWCRPRTLSDLIVVEESSLSKIWYVDYSKQKESDWWCTMYVSVFYPCSLELGR